MTNEEIIKSTETHIDELCETLKIKAKEKIRPALMSGAISEDSDFRKSNFLLAMTLVEDVAKEYTVRESSYRRECINIQKCI